MKELLCVEIHVTNHNQIFYCFKNIFNCSNEIFDGDIVIKYLLIQFNFFFLSVVKTIVHYLTDLMATASADGFLY